MFRFRKARNPFGGKQKQQNNSSMECPISLDLMKDPVLLSTGITYDRQSIETRLDAGNHTYPVTKQVLKSHEQIPNHKLRKMTQDWCVANPSYGIERIPTPRIPLTQMEVTKIHEEISVKSRRGDSSGCHELVKKIGVRVWGRESEPNRQHIVATGTSCALSEAFKTFYDALTDENTSVLEVIYLRSPASLKGLFWFLKSGTLAGRRNVVLILKELASAGQRYAEAMAETDGLLDALVKVIKEPICPTTLKGTLMVIYYMTSSCPSKEKAASRLGEMGVVSLLLEMLVESDKKALGVLDGIFSCEEAREKAYEHALTIPVLIKKVFRTSDLATEFAVSALWKLCKNYKGDEDKGIMVEALMVGVFQKVLLLLQVVGGENTKEKATGLLKMLNAYRGNGECIDYVNSVSCIRHIS